MFFMFDREMISLQLGCLNEACMLFDGDMLTGNGSFYARRGCWFCDLFHVFQLLFGKTRFDFRAYECSMYIADFINASCSLASSDVIAIKVSGINLALIFNSIEHNDEKISPRSLSQNCLNSGHEHLEECPYTCFRVRRRKFRM